MSTELSVEDGNRVIERDEHGNVVSEKVRRHCLLSGRCASPGDAADIRAVLDRPQDYTRVQAGYKAAAHNKSLTKETRQVRLSLPFSIPPALAFTCTLG